MITQSCTVLAVSVRTGQGLPCARHRWLAPKDPLQGTAESSSHLGRNSGKLYLRKGKKGQMDRENGNKKNEKMAEVSPEADRNH